MTKRTPKDLINQVPPHDPGAERAILGGVLLCEKIGEARELVPGDFYPDKHREIFRAMREMEEAGDPIDLITLGATLKNKGKLDEIGGNVYLSELMGEIPTVANAPHYVRIVKEEAFKRKIIETALETPEKIKKGDLSKVITEMRSFYEGIALSPAIEDVGFFDIDKIYEEGKTYGQGGKKTG
jgi:replicative DNA helicase